LGTTLIRYVWVSAAGNHVLSDFVRSVKETGSARHAVNVMEGMVKTMTTPKQRAAARQNIESAIKAAKRKRTVAHLPKKTRTALGKEGAKAAARKR
jgi:rRNA processing protein Krr1/Pno1